MPPIFVDSSAIYALADQGDTSHVTASRIAQRLRGADLITTDLVLAESWLLTRFRLGRPLALRLWQELRGGATQVEPIEGQDLERAWAIAVDFADRDFSLVDCATFAFIERLGIKQAFSFDHDFLVYRYGPRRSISLDVLGLSSS